MLRNAVKDGDEKAAGKDGGKALSMGGDTTTWHGSRISLISNESPEDFDVAFLKNHTLHSCARIGDVAGLKQLLKVKKLRRDVNKLDDNQMAPLHYAARYNQLESLQYLLNEGDADINVRDKQKATALHYTAKKKESSSSDKEAKKAAKEVICFLAAEMRKRGMDLNTKDQYDCTALYFAAMRGNEIVTKALLEEGVAVDAKDYCGTAPLHEAVIYNHLAVVRLLLDKGADPTAVDGEGITPLHLAAMQGNLKIVKKLVEKTPEDKKQKLIEAKDNTENQALHLAVENRHKAVVQYLLQFTSVKGLNAKCRTLTTDSTCLHLAALTGSTEIPDLLIKKGADIKKTDGAGMTALHLAVEYGNNGLAEMLIRAGADLEARDHEFLTPLLLCCCSNNPDGIKLLLKNEADIYAADDNENTAIRLAVQYGNDPETLKILFKQLKKLDNKEFADMPDRMGIAPLHIAAKLGREKIVDIFLDNGADIYAKSEEEKTPFHLAAEHGNINVCQQILEATDNKGVNDEDEDSNTALHLASMNGHVEIVRLLVDSGADKMARNVDQWTPLDWASAEGRSEVVKYLLSEDVPVNPMDKNKFTPLHLACKYGHLDIVKELLEKGADVGEKDRHGNNALDIAIANHNVEVASMIIESDHWRNALMNETYSGKSKVRQTPLRKLVLKMPEVAHQVLERCVSTGPENTAPDHENFYIDFDYEFVDDNFAKWHEQSTSDLMRTQDAVYEHGTGRIAEGQRPYTETTSLLKDNHMLMLMVSCNRGDLVSHPLILGLIRRKWNKASIFYYTFLVFYALFVALLSGFMLEATPPYFDRDSNETSCKDRDYDRNDFETVASLWMFIFSIAGMLLELFQLFAIRGKYLEPNNLLDWYTYISTVILVQDFRDCSNDERRTHWQWQLGVFTVFIAWMNFLLFLRRLPRIGIYVVMITEIFKTFLSFFTIFFLFIVAFATCFSILLRNQDPFSDVWRSIIKTWVMMIGEFDFGDIFYQDPGDSSRVAYEASTFAIFVAFVVLMAIIVMNLLTGLAVDDVSELQANAEIKKVTMQIELALDVEVALPYMVQRWSKFILRNQRLYPNRQGNIVVKLIREFIEGNYMSKEAVMDKVLGNVLTLDPNREEQNYRQNLFKKIKKNKNEIRDLKTSVTRIEEMLTHLIEIQGKKGQKKERRRSRIIAEETIPEYPEYASPRQEEGTSQN